MRKTKEHYEEKMYGSEPTFEYEETTDVDLYNTHAFNWYNANFSASKKRDWVVEYLKYRKYSEDDIADFELADLTLIPSWAAIYSRMIINGCKMKLEWKASLNQKINELVKIGYNKKSSIQSSEDSTTNDVNIQYYIKEKVALMMADINKQIDYIISGSPGQFNLDEWIESHGIKPLHTRHLMTMIDPIRSEFKKALAGNDPELTECYSYIHHKKKQKLIDFIDDVKSKLEQKKEQAKAFKAPRKRKAKPAVKQIAKLNYKAKDETYGDSILASKIVGASTIFLFNVETRALIEYNASTPEGFGVKGTTLVNVDSSKSYSKTIRKPAEVLPLVRTEGKRAINNFVKEIKAVEKPVKARINDNMIILRAF